MRLIVFGIIFSLFVFSCNSDETGGYEVGSDFIDSNIDLKLIDTFTIKTGTYKFDELPTSGTNRILLGNIVDSNFGIITSKTYLELQASSYGLSLNNSEYDSIGFVLNYDGYYSGDTLVPQTYKIYELDKEFEIDDEDDNEYYNNSTYLELDSYSNELGSITFLPEPHTDSIYIPLDINIGAEIYKKIEDDEITSNDEFIEYFKGITIVPDENVDSNIIGFNTIASFNNSTNSSMRIYYTTTIGDNEGVSRYIEFTITSSDQQFNTIENSYTDKNLINGMLTDNQGNTIDVENVIDSEDTNGLVYVEAGVGISARINMPSIKKLNGLSESGTALGAVLTFKPYKPSYDNDVKNLKDSLNVYVINEKNEIENILTDIDGNSAYAILNEEDDLNPTYNIDLGGFVKDITESEKNLGYSLMLQFGDLYNSVDRLVIQNTGEKDEKMKLTVQYLNY